jgi:hypothetical protein
VILVVVSLKDLLVVSIKISLAKFKMVILVGIGGWVGHLIVVVLKGHYDLVILKQNRHQREYW